MTRKPSRKAATVKATRRRGDTLVQAIYQATFAEVIDGGFEELSFDRIAAKTGAGKASLYRRWASPRDLLIDALTDPVAGFGEATEPKTGAVRSDLLQVLNHLADALKEPHGRAMAALVTQRSRNPDLYAHVESALIQPYEAVALKILKAGVRRGEVKPSAANARVAAVGSRLVVAEYTYSGSIDEAEVGAILDEIVMPAIGRPGNGSAKKKAAVAKKQSAKKATA